MAHNAEHEACDLLMEIEQMDMLEEYIDDNAYAKVCLYLTSCVSYVPEPENSALLRCALSIFRKFNRYPEALRLALMLNDMELAENIFISCKDVVVQKQMAFMLGRHGVFLELSEDVEEYEDLTEIMSNLDIMEPKVPDDIYKTHLENNRFGGSGSQVDSARMNLASSFVNGFVNAAFGQDKLLTDDGNKWLYKNKDHGALLACGIVNSGVRNECDPALALLSDYVLHNSNTMRIGAIFGLGLAYAGSNREDVLTLLLPVMGDSKSSMELRYGEPTLRRAVPLALALISVSNPRLNILDTLSKFSHDADPEVSYNSIFAMGMVGSGTNNARLAAMLRQLAQYHAKDPNNLFMVRLAQGLTHLGKGTLTLCPYHSDRQLMSQVAVAGLLTVLVSFLDAVDVVGQAGKPKTITGFQTHTTPVLLAHGERAELATEEHIPVTPILEGFVILRKNPNYDV
ncbi:hypothetical protein JD844_007752 [Phrynosoma platyrhinos]|uniref:26S proteasome non-ATPase regulatory subunit 2 n=1 Tax=Phrynosoma platyrhinos TaxID=52577 RepID=A0ABQ7T3R3_PHRPL|nr:hypothetical protein JD844_007752 [Phrynosoma platyrhinos]